MSRRRGALIAGLLLAPTAALAEAPAGPPPPPTFVRMLPVGVSLIAVLPVDGKGDLVDLDLRIEVVLPLGCKDQVAGLARRGGPRLDGADAYDVIVERPSVGECGKQPTRIGRRWAIRMRVAEGTTAPLTIGEAVHQVARQGGKVTLDGEPPAGDLPGAPPTDPPRTLTVGEVATAKLLAIRPLPGEGRSSAVLDFAVETRWPRCVKGPLGLLGRGDAASKFALAYFQPLAVAPLDGSCGPVGKPRPSRLGIVARRGPDYALTIGAVKFAGRFPAAATAKP